MAQPSPEIRKAGYMRKALKFLDKYFEIICLYLFMSILCISVTLQVVTRILVSSFSWTEEIARFSFVWFSMTGISFGIMNNLHINIDVLVGKFPETAQKIIDIVTDIIIAGVWCFLFYLSMDFVKFGHMKKAPALNISMTVLNISAPVGMFMCMLRSIQKAVLNIIDFKKRQNSCNVEVVK